MQVQCYVMECWARCKQKKSDRASLQDEMVCLDCPLTKKRLEWVRSGLIDLSTISNRCTLVMRFWDGQKSRSEIRRLFAQGGVSLNDHVLRRAEMLIEVHDGDVFRVGKRTWFRLRVNGL